MCGIDHKAAGVSKTLLRENESSKTSIPSDAVVINLDHGDPVIFEQYWRKKNEECTLIVPGDQSLSYFSNFKSLCWFLEPDLEQEIKQLHRMVGNASVEDYHIVVGNGSTQLIQAALFALCPSDVVEPVNVVSAAPYYSCYPEMTDFLHSRLYKWAGDASCYNKSEPYVEFVTSPNNPDGSIREAVVKSGAREGKLVHDLAYYWPQYTPITCCAHYDIMLFTVSKCTGHAGSRIGWALVKDEDVARRMTKFIEVNTIGVSKESQLRATKIIRAISNSCLKTYSNNFFVYTRSLIFERWQMLREVIRCSEIFSLSGYRNEYCLFTREFTESHPAFAWLKCNKSVEDLEKLLRGYNILARSGRRFGSDMKHVRISMVGKEEDFNLFLRRLLDIQKELNLD